MDATNTGEMFTDEQIQEMTIKDFNAKGIVKINSDEETLLAGKNRKERRLWLKANKKFKKI